MSNEQLWFQVLTGDDAGFEGQCFWQRVYPAEWREGHNGQRYQVARQHRLGLKTPDGRVVWTKMTDVIPMGAPPQSALDALAAKRAITAALPGGPWGELRKPRSVEVTTASIGRQSRRVTTLAYVFVGPGPRVVGEVIWLGWDKTNEGVSRVGVKPEGGEVVWCEAWQTCKVASTDVRHLADGAEQARERGMVALMEAGLLDAATEWAEAIVALPAS